MVKIIDFNQATRINLRFKKENIAAVLHLHAGCAYCVPEVEWEHDDDMERIYAIMNELLNPHFIHVKPDEWNPHNVVVY